LPEKSEMPATMQTVSVIVPAYQASKTIGRALASIAAQTVPPTEVIVIDDGSDDGSVRAAENMRQALKGIDLKILRQEHRGAGAARNRGVNEARSTYVAFLDADDEWLPEKLSRSLEEIIRTDSVLVSHNYILRDTAGRETVVMKCDKNFQAPGDPFVNLYRKGYVGTSAVVTKRDAVLMAGGFDESLPTAQDFALWLAMLKRPGTPFHVFSDALIRYHVTAGSISSHTERRLECCLIIARRFLPDLATRPGLPLTSFIYRVLAVHHEAITAFLARGKIAKAASVFVRIPVNLIKWETGHILRTNKQSLVSTALWLWVLGGSAAYLYQFRSFVDPVARILGFK